MKVTSEGVMAVMLVAMASLMAFERCTGPDIEVAGEIAVLTSEAETAADSVAALTEALEAALRADSVLQAQHADSSAVWAARTAQANETALVAQRETLRMSNRLRETLNADQTAQFDSIRAEDAIEKAAIREERDIARAEVASLTLRIGGLESAVEIATAGWDQSRIEADRWRSIAEAEESLKRKAQVQTKVWQGTTALVVGVAGANALGLIG